MPELPLTVLILGAAAGSAVTGAVYTVFSARVMPRLAARPTAEAVAAMQELNRRVLRSPFMIAFFGAAAACAVILWVALGGGLRADGAVLAALGAGAHLLGWALTVLWNVPRNRALDAVGAGTAGAEPAWRRYLGQWTPANTVRAVLSWAAAGLLVAAVLR